mgnify:FL=1
MSGHWRINYNNNEKHKMNHPSVKQMDTMNHSQMNHSVKQMDHSQMDHSKQPIGSNPCTDKLTDIEYLVHMIPHHQVAIDMSNMLIC